MFAREVVENEVYSVTDMDGEEWMTMRREPEFGGFWVLRNKAGDALGWDQYRHDLFARFKIEVVRQ